MSNGSIGPRRGAGRSPFDDIKQTHENPDGTTVEQWSAREAMAHLGYATWHNMKNVLKRARAACRNSGHSVPEHFTDVSKMRPQGGPRQRDTVMTRFGMYLLAMNGDPNKPEIAPAQRYFAIQTYRAEQQLEPIAPPPATPPVDIRSATPQFVLKARPWAERIRKMWLPHLSMMGKDHPEHFTIICDLVWQVMYMEDEILRHEMSIRSKDRPDNSVGRRWSDYRRDTLGLADVVSLPPLYLQEQDITVELKLYHESEWNAFRKWFREVYLPDHYLTYVDNKKEWRHDTPEVTHSSVADHTALGLSRRNANLPADRRTALRAAGDFAPRALPPRPPPPALGR